MATLKQFGIICLLMFNQSVFANLAIKHVEIVNDTIEPIIHAKNNQHKRTEAIIRFFLTQKAEVNLNIFDARDQQVYESVGRILSRGEHEIKWQGVDHQGKRVPPEAYVFTLKASDNQGNIVEYDVTDHTRGVALRGIKPKWNSKEQLISFGLKKAARVNIRAGINGGPVLDTLLDWVPRKAGQHNVSWSGYDRDKRIKIADHPNLSLVVDAFTLPFNTLYVLPEVAKPRYLDIDTNHFSPRQSKKILHTQPLHQLARRDAKYRRDYSVTIEFVGYEPSNAKESDSLPVLKGKVPIKISVADKDLAILNSSRYEVALFIDGLYHYENEIAFIPTTYYLDVSTLQNGEHYISANIMSFDGNFGFTTRKVRFEK